MEFPKGNNKRLLKNEKSENNSSKKLKFDIKEKEDFTTKTMSIPFEEQSKAESAETIYNIIKSNP